MSKEKIYFILPVILLIIFGIVGRFLPHPANFAPIGAIAIFGAIYLPKKWSLVIPLTVMFLTDIFIGFYSLPIMLSVYGSFGIMWFIGTKIKNYKKFHTILGGTVLGSIIFFLITNWAVWAFGTMYTHNLTGLLQSYYMAIPFFRNSLFSDLFYTSSMIIAMELLLIIRNTCTQCNNLTV